jgi:hypothetical protein
VFDENEPAAAGGIPEEICMPREEPRHRMVEAGHQCAVDEETITGHGASIAVNRAEQQRDTFVVLAKASMETE